MFSKTRRRQFKYPRDERLFGLSLGEWPTSCHRFALIDQNGTATGATGSPMLQCKKDLPRPVSSFISPSPFAVACPINGSGARPAGGRFQHEQGRPWRQLSGGVLSPSRSGNRVS